MDVLKESIWSVDVRRTIQGLRDAADGLAAVGVPADAEISVTFNMEWLHVEARFLYTDEGDSDLAEPQPTLPTAVTS